jgi:hypothetical protein
MVTQAQAWQAFFNVYAEAMVRGLFRVKWFAYVPGRSAKR